MSCNMTNHSKVKAKQLQVILDNRWSKNSSFVRVLIFSAIRFQQMHKSMDDPWVLGGNNVVSAEEPVEVSITLNDTIKRSQKTINGMQSHVCNLIDQARGQTR